MHPSPAVAPVLRDPAPSPVVSALTVDVEEHFQVSGFERDVPRERWSTYPSRVEANTERLLALCADANVRATFFLLGWTAERHPALVRRIRGAGHEVACHSYAHRLVYTLTPAEFREDTRRAKTLIEDLAGCAVIGYRAPSFSITRASLWALDILAAEGFRYDSSVYPILRDRYGIPGAPRHAFPVRLRRGGGLLEIPPTTARWLGVNLPAGGGGYLRAFPEWVFRRALASVIQGERRPAVLYIHPWELDAAQPRIPGGSWISRFRHYRNLAWTEPRLRGLLATWRFTCLAELVPTLSAQAGPPPDLERRGGPLRNPCASPDHPAAHVAARRQGR